MAAPNGRPMPTGSRPVPSGAPPARAPPSGAAPPGASRGGSRARQMISANAGGSKGRAMLMQKRRGGAAPSRPRPLPSGPPPGGSAGGTPSSSALPQDAPEGKQENSLHEWDKSDEGAEGKEAETPLNNFGPPSEGKADDTGGLPWEGPSPAAEGKSDDAAEGKDDDANQGVHAGGEVPMGRRAARPSHARPDAHTTVLGGGSTSPLPGLQAFEAIRSPKTQQQQQQGVPDDGGSDSEDSLLMEITDGSATGHSGVGSSNPHLRSVMMDDAGNGSATARRRGSGTALRRESDAPPLQGAWGGSQPLPWGDHRRNADAGLRSAEGRRDDVAEEDLDMSGDGSAAVHSTPGRARVLSDPGQLPQDRADVPEMRSASPNDQSAALRRAMGPAGAANRTPARGDSRQQPDAGPRHVIAPVRISQGRDSRGDFATGGPQPVRESGLSRGPTPPLGGNTDEAEPSPSMARAYSDPAEGNDPQRLGGGEPVAGMPSAYPAPAAAGSGVGSASHGEDDGQGRARAHHEPPPPKEPLEQPPPRVVPIDLPPHTVLKGQAGALAGYSASSGRQPFAIVDEDGSMVVKVPQGPGELELVEGKQLRRCVQKGWLRKRPEQGEWYKGWKRRYFRVVVHTEVVAIHAANAWGYSLDEKIQAAMLHYYEDEDPGTEAKATVPLIGCDAEMVSNPAVLAKYPYCFQVTHPRRRTYFLDPCLPEGTPPEDADAVSRNWVQIIRAGVETTNDLFVKRFKRQGQGPAPAAPPVAGMATAAAASPFRDSNGRMVGSPGFRPDPRSPMQGPQRATAMTPPRSVGRRDEQPTSPHAAYGHFGQQVSR